MRWIILKCRFTSDIQEFLKCYFRYSWFFGCKGTIFFWRDKRILKEIYAVANFLSETFCWFREKLAIFSTGRKHIGEMSYLRVINKRQSRPAQILLTDCVSWINSKSPGICVSRTLRLLFSDWTIRVRSLWSTPWEQNYLLNTRSWYYMARLWYSFQQN